MKMQANPYTRSTTASRRVMRRFTDKYLFISAPIKVVTSTDKFGVVTETNVVGATSVYNKGRNAMKRACAVLGISRVQFERAGGAV